MEVIKSPLTRKLLEDELKKLHNEFTDYFDPHTLSTFENELKLIDQHRRAAIRTNSKHAEPIILTSYVGLISLVDLGVTLVYNRLRRKLLPRHWLGEKRDANSFLGEFVLSASNQVLAVIYLCKVGLEWPARVLLRTVKELLNIGIVLVSDPATMKKYLALHPINDKKDWYQHFSRGRVSSNLADLNRAFGLPEKDIATWLSIESRHYSLLSKHAHGSFLPVVLGAYYAPVDDPTRLRYSFYGAASVGIKETLAGLNWEIQYFNLMLWKILANRHYFKFARKKDRWESIYVLAKLHESLYKKAKRKERLKSQ